MKTLILASGSPYRKLLLERLLLPFDSVSPQVEEERLPGETGVAMAGRLARLKAEEVAARYPSAVVIGSDQVAQLGEQLLGKPGTTENACEQLRRSSGQQVTFYTGVCVINGSAQEQAVETFRVQFRDLSEQEIQRYVALERPLDCAGSFKCEGLGSVLFQWLRGNDPTTLQGLPLIRVAEMLRRQGIDPLTNL